MRVATREGGGGNPLTDRLPRWGRHRPLLTDSAFRKGGRNRKSLELIEAFLLSQVGRGQSLPDEPIRVSWFSVIVSSVVSFDETRRDVIERSER